MNKINISFRWNNHDLKNYFTLEDIRKKCKKIHKKKIIHTKLTIEGNAQIIPLTQHNIKAKALNATHGSKFNC